MFLFPFEPTLGPFYRFLETLVEFFILFSTDHVRGNGTLTGQDVYNELNGFLTIPTDCFCLLLSKLVSFARYENFSSPWFCDTFYYSPSLLCYWFLLPLGSVIDFITLLIWLCCWFCSFSCFCYSCTFLFLTFLILLSYISYIMLNKYSSLN